MAHKVLVGGTAYDLTGGKTLIGGTEYSVTKGRTLIGGTGYDISFVKATFDEVIADMNVLAIDGRNNSSEGYIVTAVNITYSRTFYVFQFLNGYLTISRVDCEYIDDQTAPIVTKTDLNAVSASYTPYVVGGTSVTQPLVRAYVSTNGTEYYRTYAAVIAIVEFPTYPPSVVDKAIRGVTLTKKAGRDSSTTAYIGFTPYNAADRLFAAARFGSTSVMSYSSPIGTVVFSSSPDFANPSLLIYPPFYSSGTWLSSDGTSRASLRGGSIVAVTE